MSRHLGGWRPGAVYAGPSKARASAQVVPRRYRLDRRTCGRGFGAIGNGHRRPVLWPSTCRDRRIHSSATSCRCATETTTECATVARPTSARPAVGRRVMVCLRIAQNSRAPARGFATRKSIRQIVSKHGRRPPVCDNDNVDIDGMDAAVFAAQSWAGWCGARRCQHQTTGFHGSALFTSYIAGNA